MRTRATFPYHCSCSHATPFYDRRLQLPVVHVLFVLGTKEEEFAVYEPYCANYTNASELMLMEEQNLQVSLSTPTIDLATASVFRGHSGVCRRHRSVLMYTIRTPLPHALATAEIQPRDQRQIGAPSVPHQTRAANLQVSPPTRRESRSHLSSILISMPCDAADGTV